MRFVCSGMKRISHDEDPVTKPCHLTIDLIGCRCVTSLSGKKYMCSCTEAEGGNRFSVIDVSLL